MSDITDKLEGKAKEVIGVVTNDRKLEADGKAQQVKGEAKGKAKEGLDKVGDKINDLKRDINKK